MPSLGTFRAASPFQLCPPWHTQLSSRLRLTRTIPAAVLGLSYGLASPLVSTVAGATPLPMTSWLLFRNSHSPSWYPTSVSLHDPLNFGVPNAVEDALPLGACLHKDRPYHIVPGLGRSLGSIPSMLSKAVSLGSV